MQNGRILGEIGRIVSIIVLIFATVILRHSGFYTRSDKNRLTLHIKIEIIFFWKIILLNRQLVPIYYRLITEWISVTSLKAFG